MNTFNALLGWGFYKKPVFCSGGGTSGSSNSDSGSSDSGGGGYTSLADMFDGGGAGGSGDTFYSGSHDDYVASGGTGAVSHSSSNDDNDDSSPAPAPAETSSNTGYTSLVDMFDGGGAGGSGSEFYSGSHADYENTAAGAADAASDAAGTTNYESGSYTSVTDMLDGGGPGMSGDTFEGPVSDISTGLGATPLGSGIEPTGVAGFINSGGITGALVNALAGGIDTITGAGTTAQPGETSSSLAPETSITPMARPDDLGTGTSDSESTGYTSIIDMIDGGGPGASGDEFGGALGGVSNAIGLTPFGSADEPGFLAGVSGYGYYDDAGNYVPATVDMIDGGGAGTSGDEFGGALGGISNAVGATPYGSGIEPTGVAGVVNDAVTGAANVVENIFNDNTTSSSTVDNSVVNTTNTTNNTYNTVPDTIQLLGPDTGPDYIVPSTVGDWQSLSVGQPGGGATNFDLEGVGQPGIVGAPAATEYLPSEGLMALQNMYANAPTQQAVFGIPGQQNMFPSLNLPQLNSQQFSPVVDPYGLFQFNQRFI